jgi:hypothetical protein
MLIDLKRLLLEQMLIDLLPLPFSFDLEYAKERLELNGTHQLLSYADDVNLLGENINITKKGRKQGSWSRSKRKEN